MTATAPESALPDRADRAAASHEDSAGRPRRLGPYTLLGELGRGGAGVVFRARQAVPERSVALKLLSGTRFTAGRERARLLAEAGIASRLDHPGIVPVFEVGEADGQPYYTMALVEGGSLEQRLAAGPLEPDEAAALLLQLCDAIDYAHRQGILHRDLKPANVLFDRSGHARVADFGLAKDVDAGDDLTRTGEIVGTPSYMAPEQITGEGPVDARADVYALGCVLYACLTGSPPFRAASVLATLRQVVDSVPVPARLANAAVPRELDAICSRCLERRPEERYASAAELAEDLCNFREGRPVRAEDGRTNAFLKLMLQESRYTDVMARWSRIGMVHALLVLGVYLATGALALRGVATGWMLAALWIPGGALSVAVPVVLRRRRGPLTQVERQLAQVWCMFALAAALTTACHVLAGAPPLELVPIVLAEAALAIGCMSVVLRGSFYSLSIAYASFALAVAATPAWAIAPLGAAVSGLHFAIARRAGRRVPSPPAAA